ncbi:hypothetical protein [Pseudorhodoferax sp.]|uniref:hypothetical protein n=1 Tax=Pseudorhodoferax sp. TaxID=1993553 RepID=UPI002DD676B2|nr:hypothetical protein [Pseudorhodoferax sp.]
MQRRLLLLALPLGAVGCTSPPQTRGSARGEPASASEAVQSDTNRMATLAMRDNLASLMLLADKLYRRNPAEWRRAGQPSRDAALDQLAAAIRLAQPPASLLGRRDIAAMALALQPDFVGDRVAAFVYATADMLITAHGGKTSFNLLDGLEPQLLHNAARNVEAAAWLLATRRNQAGQPLLLADEINASERNLSFEREFGKIIGRLDLLAAYLTEKLRRAAIGYVQSLLGGQFFQFLPVR